MVVKLDPFGCVLESCIIPKPTLQPEPSEAAIFPNPFSNALQFSYYNDAFDEQIHVAVYDHLGRKIISTNAIATRDAQSFDTTGWNAG